MGQFALTGLLAVLLVGGVGVLLLRHGAREDAIGEAKALARLAGHGIVAPSVTPQLLRGERRAQGRLDRVVRSEILGHEGVLRVKIWSADGRIVYSDQPALIGQRFTVSAEQREALQTGRAAAELTVPDRAENEFEPGESQLLEVYLPIRSPTGVPLLFEMYQRGSELATDTTKTWLAFLPGLIALLLLLHLLQIPLAQRMARRLERQRTERQALLQRAIDASETERRRIAGDLHDGVVQDLTARAYGFWAAAAELGRDAPAGVLDTLENAARDTRRNIRQLRTLLVDLYPPDLHRSRFDIVLSDLAAPLESRGLDVRLDLPERVELPPGAKELMFRTAQEALRNVLAHSGATEVEVRLAVGQRQAVLSVGDNGRGMSSERLHHAGGDGHFGLRVLADVARDAGGRLDIASAPGRGTTLHLQLPVGPGQPASESARAADPTESASAATSALA